MNQKNRQKLKNYLEVNQEKNGGMNLYKLHGFFTCLAIGPETIMPSDWLPLVLGGGPETELENEEFLNLIMTYYNSICHCFAENTKEYKIPLDREKSDKNKTMLTNWAVGFYQGMHYDLDFWEDFLVTNEYKYFYLLVGNQIPEIAAKLEFDLNRFNKDIDAYKEDIETILINIYTEILEFRKECAAVTEQIIKEPKVGRNDPCPCGSGKKFKKCCMN
ncbi:MAG: UPF0149 family protein [Fidelibacterota bacterium]